MKQSITLMMTLLFSFFFSCKPRSGKDSEKCKDDLKPENRLTFRYCDTCYTVEQALGYERSLGSIELKIVELDYKRLFSLYGSLDTIGPERKDTLDWMKLHPDTYNYLFFLRIMERGAYWYEISVYKIDSWQYKKKPHNAILSIEQKYFVQDRYFSIRFPNFVDKRDTTFDYDNWKKQFNYLECYGRAHYPDKLVDNTISPYDYGESVIPEKFYVDTKTIIWNNYEHIFTISSPVRYFLENFGGKLEQPITEKDMAIYTRKIQLHDTGYLRLFPDWKNVEPIIIKSVRKKK